MITPDIIHYKEEKILLGPQQLELDDYTVAVYQNKSTQDLLFWGTVSLFNSHAVVGLINVSLRAPGELEPASHASLMQYHPDDLPMSYLCNAETFGQHRNKGLSRLSRALLTKLAQKMFGTNVGGYIKEGDLISLKSRLFLPRINTSDFYDTRVEGIKIDTKNKRRLWRVVTYLDHPSTSEKQQAIYDHYRV